MGAKGTPATALLRQRKVAYRTHSYRHDQQRVGYGQEAVESLGVPPEQVLKTLVAEVDGQLTVAVIPVARQLDLKALAAATGGKRARMAATADAERATGYVAGGISPLGQRRRLPVVLDTSVTGFDVVFCSGGRRGLEIELSPADLVELCSAALAPIAS